MATLKGNQAGHLRGVEGHSSRNPGGHSQERSPRKDKEWKIGTPGRRRRRGNLMLDSMIVNCVLKSDNVSGIRLS